jgi:hypothetical protein
MSATTVEASPIQIQSAQELFAQDMYMKVGMFGPSGSGKTMTALDIACKLYQNQAGKVGLIDTERGSSSLYSDTYNFSIVKLDSFTVDNLFAALDAFYKAGFKFLIIDSMSAFWNGTNGVTETVAASADMKRQAKAQRGEDVGGGNTMLEWVQGNKIHKAEILAIMQVPMHVICTFRAATRYESETNAKGRFRPVQAGIKPESKNDVISEFDLMMCLHNDDGVHSANIVKSRVREFSGKTIENPTGESFQGLYDFFKFDANK